MCMNFQKRLQTKDQVYTELKVEVDSTWGGCPTGFENCSQYADCNPSSGANKTVDWRCDCKHTAPAPKHSFLSTIRSTPRAQKQISASDYWSCNDALETSCGASLWNSKACNTCAGVHKSALSAAKCTPQYLSGQNKLCTAYTHPQILHCIHPSTHSALHTPTPPPTHPLISTTLAHDQSSASQTSTNAAQLCRKHTALTA
jgi:hypothetical protein